MILLKELWIYHILPQVPFLDLLKFQQVSRKCFELTKPFLHEIETWKSVVHTGDFNGGLCLASQKGLRDLVDFCVSRGAR